MAEIVIRDLGDVQEFRGCFCAPNVRFEDGGIALSALQHATAEDLLKVFHGRVPDVDAKTIVDILLANDLTFDSVIESELRELGRPRHER